jgi:eukaryotic-like serine/threonine-protein kinase
VATLYEATGPGGDRVAVKVMHQELAANPARAEQFLSAAEILCSLHHANIVRSLAFGRCPDGRPYLVMERIVGRSLVEILAEETALPTPKAIDLATQVCAGLAAAHRHALLHLDLHPGNILVADGPQQTVKLVDFGLRPGPRRAAMGVPEYLAPEQVLGRPVDERTDIYALGVILYEALTGRYPFRSHSAGEMAAQHLYAPPPMPRARPGSTAIPSRVAHLVLQCMAKEPAQRFGSALALGAALAALPRRSASAVEIPAVTPPPRPRRTPAGLLAVGAVSLAALGALGAHLLLGRQAARTPRATATLTITSEPPGASVRVPLGPRLGQTPLILEWPRADAPVPLLVRYPDGAVACTLPIPDRPVYLHLRQGSSP